MGSVTSKTYNEKEIASVFSIPKQLCRKLVDWGVVCKKIEFLTDKGNSMAYLISLNDADIGNGMDIKFYNQLEVAQKLIEISFVLTAREKISGQMAIAGSIDENKSNMVPFIKEITRDFPKRKGELYRLFKEARGTT